jgi:hypothetical protein
MHDIAMHLAKKTPRVPCQMMHYPDGKYLIYLEVKISVTSPLLFPRMKGYKGERGEMLQMEGNMADSLLFLRSYSS